MFPTNFYIANGLKLCPNGDKMRSRDDGSLFCPGEDELEKAEQQMSLDSESKPLESKSRSTAKKLKTPSMEGLTDGNG